MMINKSNLFGTLLCLCLGAAVSYGTITDDFSGDNDFQNNLAGTVWDGAVVNSGVSLVQDGDLIDLDTTTNDDALTYTTTNTHWAGVDDDGALMYIVIPADTDFSARVQILPGSNFKSFDPCFERNDDWNGTQPPAVTWHSAGLMVRNPVAETTADIDWQALFAFDHWQWGSTHIFRSTDDGAETNQNSGDLTIAELPWLRLDRTGTTLTAYKSANGNSWTMHAEIEREDLAGQVHVGLAHGLFSANTATAILDNFSLDAGPIPFAPDPKPFQGMYSDLDNPLFTEVPVDKVLSWAAPSDPNLEPGFTITYDVYLDPNQAAVETGDPTALVSEVQEGTSFTPPADLDFDTVYYWRVVANVDLDYEPAATDVSSALWSFRTVPLNQEPIADAGADIVSWLEGGSAIETLAGGLALDDGVPVAATPSWKLIKTSPEGLEGNFSFDDPCSFTATATMTATGTYTLELTVDDTVFTDTDTMKITVYADSCLAAKAQPGYTRNPADINDDCDVNLADLQLLAEDFLKSTALTN